MAAVKIQHKNCLQSTLRKKVINTLFAGLGRSVLGKTVPSVLGTVRLRAVLKTSGTVFPNTDFPAGKSQSLHKATHFRGQLFQLPDIFRFFDFLFGGSLTALVLLSYNRNAAFFTNVSLAKSVSAMWFKDRPRFFYIITLHLSEFANYFVAFVKERFHNAVEIDILGIVERYSSLQIWPPQKIFQGRNYSGRMT